ncbi:MAG: hypothetical protein V9E99_00485 [Microthrixaceae bacterium]|nr:hypothetical protein [Microthrixaceae bacterium]HMT25778.1 hypothetical protein [Microthrixaceae bacterium]HMT61976.1 hypothetical protein [Microthrixaceae bacterium]
MTKVLIAVGVVVVGVAIASIAAGLVRRRMMRESSRSELKQVAGAASSLVFWAVVAAAIVGAVSVSSPKTLEPIPGDLLRYLPNALVAGLFLIGGRVIGVLVATATTQAIGRATGEQPKSLGGLIRGAITALTALLALGQLGIDTDVLLMLTGGVILSVALSLSILAGVGGVGVARQLAAGRTLRPILKVGAVIETPEYAGVIRRLHPSKLEIERADGRRLFVSYDVLLESSVVIDS